MNTKLLYDTHERPPVTHLIVLAFQHVFAMFGATILVPVLINKAAGTEVISISTALLASGVGTLLYLLCTKGKSQSSKRLVKTGSINYYHQLLLDQ